jgi:SHS2 domain-containing protein
MRDSRIRYRNKPGGPAVTDKPPFEVFEHTADAGIVARGRDLPELFENAALGMFSLMAELAGVREREHREISVKGHDLETLMVQWLTELLYYLDAEDMLFSRFRVRRLSDGALEAEAFGEPIDRDRHELHFGIKAVTRHMLEVTGEDGGYRSRILFDI